MKIAEKLLFTPRLSKLNPEVPMLSCAPYAPSATITYIATLSGDSFFSMQ